LIIGMTNIRVYCGFNFKILAKTLEFKYKIRYKLHFKSTVHIVSYLITEIILCRVWLNFDIIK